MNYTKIASPSNLKIKYALDVKAKRSRYRGDAFIIEGTHLIEMALTSGHRIVEVFFVDKFSAKKEGQKLLRRLFKRSDEIFEVTENILKKLTDTETPQGILAIASYIPKNLNNILLKTIPLLVVIDGIQEPGNLGTIIRTSDAAGADVVIILPGTCDVFMQKTLRATAGSIFNIPIVHTESNEIFEWLSLKGIELIVTDTDAKQSIFDTNLKNPVAFVFGNEAHGVSSQMKNKADVSIKIPIHGKAESLNVAASTAVCLYEAVRQRRKSACV
ncbi:MAG: RNA methyltransferase [Nitrospirae bacterium]|nr:RNA methyltransferase [Nitrospirota bacterium]